MESIQTKVTRLTFNDRRWIEPSGPYGKSKSKGLHESEYGFGHEEWIFDFSKLIKGFKYGFIEGLRTKNNKHAGKTYNLRLFAINSESKQKQWVALINNCYVLTNEEQSEARRFFEARNWIIDIQKQLKRLHLWNKKSEQSIKEFGANVRFLERDVQILKEPISIENLQYAKDRERYLLYDWEETIVESDIEVDDFFFEPSSPNPEIEVHRSKTPDFKSTEIKQLHRKILESLYKDLCVKYGSNVIGCDVPTKTGTYIDMVRKNGSQFIFYEIKTYDSLRKNIREAIGQLLEYSYWKRNKKVKELVIVSKHRLDSEAEDFLTFLKNSFRIPISYLQQPLS